MKTEKQAKAKLKRVHKDLKRAFDVVHIIMKNGGNPTSSQYNLVARLSGQVEMLRWFLK